MNVSIVGEIQLAQRILRRIDFLLGNTFQQFSCFRYIWYQQPTVAVRCTDDVLYVSIACFHRLLQLLRGFSPFL